MTQFQLWRVPRTGQFICPEDGSEVLLEIKMRGQLDGTDEPIVLRECLYDDATHGSEDQYFLAAICDRRHVGGFGDCQILNVCRVPWAEALAIIHLGGLPVPDGETICEDCGLVHAREIDFENNEWQCDECGVWFSLWSPEADARRQAHNQRVNQERSQRPNWKDEGF
jgi:hypothetical protein